MTRHAVTGAFGYSGRQIAKRLLECGYEVVTLTNKPPQSELFGHAIATYPLTFDHPDDLAKSLNGVDVLYNTYWVRFNHKNFTHAQGVQNSGVLFDAAKSAGVRRIVHVSIANPSENLPFEYYRGKAEIEKKLTTSGIAHTILRPTVLFGRGDILINNIAWTLRRFPIVGYFGKGDYHVRPIHLDDFADLAVKCGTRQNNEIIDAVGPENYAYRDLLRLIANAIGTKNLLIPTPIWMGYLVAKFVGWIHRDTFLTLPEIGALMTDLLTSEAPPTGTTSLKQYLYENRESIGKTYANELRRR
ncbi:MAG: NAD(P)H-binding protein [Planctomycetaceae bacterium]|jgi:NADH dehydrogenase|nr:NAD(P)H-binding protein [Planctomycetaceae bacterium]